MSNTETNLYQILVSYANKNNSPYIDINSFLDFLDSLSKKQPGENSIWSALLKNRAMNFWSEASRLAGEGKCELITEGESNKIYMSFFYLETLNKEYLNVDEDKILPFPSEESLKIKLPESEVINLVTEYDLIFHLESLEDSAIKILKIIFPDEFGSALVLTSMIPQRLTELAIVKVRNYLLRYANKDYAYNKLSTQLQGREVYLREALDKLVQQPLVLYPDIEAGGELAYLFWAHFGALVKSDVKKKRERLPMDIAAFQSVFIIEAIIKYFKALAVKNREAEAAFKNLESHLNKTPYIYSMDEILKFTNPKGEPLLGKYTEEALENWLRKKTTESADGKLPALILMPGSTKNEQYFILKDKILSLCSRYLTEARLQVKDTVTKQWSKLLTDFKRDKTMDSEKDFEKLLVRLVERARPELIDLLANPKFFLVYQEMERDVVGVSFSTRIFSQGRLLPYSTLLNIQRRELLRDIKLSLPFWYSLPIICDIISFFRKYFGKKTPVILNELDKQESQQGSSHAGEIKAAIKALESTLIPSGQTIDDYMKNLEDRWGRLLDPKARENLIADVNNLVRDYMRRTLRLQKQYKPTRESLNQLAANLVTSNEGLASLREREALTLYLELRMLKILKSTNR